MNPDFTFNEKSGELSRGGRIVMLKPYQTEIIALLMAVPIGEHVPVASFMERLRRAKTEIAIDMAAVRARIRRLGLTIQGQRTHGYRLLVHDMPARWRPQIQPPVAIGDR